MEYKSCCFIGHNEVTFSPDFVEILKEEIENLIVKQNYGVFRFGGVGEFDYKCWKLVNELKEKYPFIKTALCLWSGKYPWWAKKRKYDSIEELPLDYDYWYSRLYYRNTAMIDACDLSIFYVTNTENSGAYKAMKHAIKHKKNYINYGKIEEK